MMRAAHPSPIIQPWTHPRLRRFAAAANLYPITCRGAKSSTAQPNARAVDVAGRCAKSAPT